MNTNDRQTPANTAIGRNVAAFLLILLPIVLFGIYMWRFAVNVPYVDDVELVSTINEMIDYPSSFFEMMLRQQNDHRPLFSRIGAIMSYALTGELDFRVMKLLGFFNLIGLTFLFYKLYKRTGYGLFGFVPVVYLIFSPIEYGVHLYAITSFQSSLSVAFSIITFYFLQPGKEKIWFWSLPFAVFTTLAHLDGLSVIVLCLAWLIIQQRKRESILFALFSAVYLAIYFYDFQFSVASKMPPMAVLLPTASAAFVAFTGSFFKPFSDSMGFKLSFFAGGIILLIFMIIHLIRWLKHIRRMTVYKALATQINLTDMVFLRLLATAAMIAIGRSADGVEGVLAVRFLLYSASILSVFYILVLPVLSSRSAVYYQVAASVLSILCCIFMYIKFDAPVRLMEAEHKTDSFNYTNNQVFLHQYFDMTELPPAVYRNYKFPAFFSKNTIESWKRSIVETPGGGAYPLVLNHVGQTGEYARYFHPVIEVTLDHIPPVVPRNEVYLALLSNTSPGFFYLVAMRDLNNSWQKKVTGEQAERKFFVSLQGKVHKSVYRAALCWYQNGEAKSIPLTGEIAFGR